MDQEAQEYYNIASWTTDKVNYNRISKFNTNKHRQVLHGQIWFCDLGYNIGTEKNKMRPVLVMSNNKINNFEKVVVVCITDAKGKVNSRCLPIQDSWFLLYSDTEDEEKQVIPGRTIPASMHTYEFLDKDSMIQCEEIRAVSKSRLDANRGCIGALTPEDFNLVKGKFKRAYVTVHSVHSNVAKIHSRLPAAMEFWLICLGILAYSCQNTSRDSGV